MIPFPNEIYVYVTEKRTESFLEETNDQLRQQRDDLVFRFVDRNARQQMQHAVRGGDCQDGWVRA